LQKTAAALHAEIRLLATPVSLDAMAVSDQVEDLASFAGIAAARLDEQAGLLETLVAIEALAAAQGVDLRPPERLGPPLAAVHARIRAVVPRLDEDRPPGADVMAVLAALFPTDV
jgi:histidine ammonia-lyase